MNPQQSNDPGQDSGLNQSGLPALPIKNNQIHVPLDSVDPRLTGVVCIAPVTDPNQPQAELVKATLSYVRSLVASNQIIDFNANGRGTHFIADVDGARALMRVRFSRLASPS